MDHLLRASYFNKKKLPPRTILGLTIDYMPHWCVCLRLHLCPAPRSGQRSNPACCVSAGLRMLDN